MYDKYVTDMIWIKIDGYMQNFAAGQSYGFPYPLRMNLFDEPPYDSIPNKY